MHKCTIDSCEEQIPDERLACKGHWFTASDETRARVMTAWRSVSRSEQYRNAEPDERLRRISNLRQAQEQFKNEVQEKLAAAATPACGT